MTKGKILFFINERKNMFKMIKHQINVNVKTIQDKRSPTNYSTSVLEVFIYLFPSKTPN